MLNLLVQAITFFAVVATIVFTIWTYIDTRRKYSTQEFIKTRKFKYKKAEKRFKNKTRLGK